MLRASFDSPNRLIAIGVFTWKAYVTVSLCASSIVKVEPNQTQFQILLLKKFLSLNFIKNNIEFAVCVTSSDHVVICFSVLNLTCQMFYFLGSKDWRLKAVAACLQITNLAALAPNSGAAATPQCWSERLPSPLSPSLTWGCLTFQNKSSVTFCCLSSNPQTAFELAACRWQQHTHKCGFSQGRKCLVNPAF